MNTELTVIKCDKWYDEHGDHTDNAWVLDGNAEHVCVINAVLGDDAVRLIEQLMPMLPDSATVTIDWEMLVKEV